MNTGKVMAEVCDSLKIHLKDFLSKFNKDDRKLIEETMMNYGVLELNKLTASPKQMKYIEIDMLAVKRTLENIKIAGEVTVTKEIVSLIGSVIGIIAKSAIKAMV